MKEIKDEREKKEEKKGRKEGRKVGKKEGNSQVIYFVKLSKQLKSHTTRSGTSGNVPPRQGDHAGPHSVKTERGPRDINLRDGKECFLKMKGNSLFPKSKSLCSEKLGRRV